MLYYNHHDVVVIIVSHFFAHLILFLIRIIIHGWCNHIRGSIYCTVCLLHLWHFFLLYCLKTSQNSFKPLCSRLRFYNFIRTHTNLVSNVSAFVLVWCVWVIHGYLTLLLSQFSRISTLLHFSYKFWLEYNDVDRFSEAQEKIEMRGKNLLCRIRNTKEY